MSERYCESTHNHTTAPGDITVMYRIIDTVEFAIEAHSEPEAVRRYLEGQGECVGVISRAVIETSE